MSDPIDERYDKAAQMFDELARLEAENAALKEALNVIASWDEGETVTGSFDEPGSAHLARETLRRLPSPPKPSTQSRPSYPTPMDIAEAEDREANALDE